MTPTLQAKMSPVTPSWSRPLMTLLFGVLGLLSVSAQASAEGSAYLIKRGKGLRAALLAVDPLLGQQAPDGRGTVSLHFAYLREGEVLNLSSSAQGVGQGAIVYRGPQGLSGRCDPALGRIRDLTQERAGVGAGTPCEVLVQPGQAGLWEIEFLPPSGRVDLTAYQALDSRAPWPPQQPSDFWVRAWDVSVSNAPVKAGGAVIPGRTFVRAFAGLVGAQAQPAPWHAIWFGRSWDGFVYALDTNGIEIEALNLQASSRGLKDAAGNSIYASAALDALGNGLSILDPYALSEAGGDQTLKLFYTKPDKSLPPTAASALFGQDWLQTEPLEGQSLSALSYDDATGQLSLSLDGAGGANALELFAADTTEETEGADIAEVRAGLAQPLHSFHNLPTGASMLPLPEGLGGPVRARFTAKVAETHFLLAQVVSSRNGLRLRRMNGPKAGASDLFWNLDETPGGFDGAAVRQANSLQTPAGLWGADQGRGRVTSLWTLSPQSSEVSLLLPTVEVAAAGPEPAQVEPETLEAEVVEAEVVEAEVVEVEAVEAEVVEAELSPEGLVLISDLMALRKRSDSDQAEVDLIFELRNQTGAALENPSLTLAPARHLGGAFVQLVGRPMIEAPPRLAGSSLRLDAGYTGLEGADNLLQPGGRLQAGDSAVVRLTLHYDPDSIAGLSPLSLGAVVAGQLGGERVQRPSDNDVDGAQRDEDRDGDPANDATPLPGLRLVKAVTLQPAPLTATAEPDDYDLHFEFTLENTGGLPLQDLALAHLFAENPAVVEILDVDQIAIETEAKGFTATGLPARFVGLNRVQRFTGGEATLLPGESLRLGARVAFRFDPDVSDGPVLNRAAAFARLDLDGDGRLDTVIGDPADTRATRGVDADGDGEEGNDAVPVAFGRLSAFTILTGALKSNGGKSIIELETETSVRNRGTADLYDLVVELPIPPTLAPAFLDLAVPVRLSLAPTQGSAARAFKGYDGIRETRALETVPVLKAGEELSFAATLLFNVYGLEAGALKDLKSRVGADLDRDGDAVGDNKANSKGNRARYGAAALPLEAAVEPSRIRANLGVSIVDLVRDAQDGARVAEVATRAEPVEVAALSTTAFTAASDSQPDPVPSLSTLAFTPVPETAGVEVGGSEPLAEPLSESKVTARSETLSDPEPEPLPEPEPAPLPEPEPEPVLAPEPSLSPLAFTPVTETQASNSQALNSPVLDPQGSVPQGSVPQASKLQSGAPQAASYLSGAALTPRPAATPSPVLVPRLVPAPVRVKKLIPGPKISFPAGSKPITATTGYQLAVPRGYVAYRAPDGSIFLMRKKP